MLGEEIVAGSYLPQNNTVSVGVYFLVIGKSEKNFWRQPHGIIYKLACKKMNRLHVKNYQ